MRCTKNAEHRSVHTLGPVLAGKDFVYESVVKELISILGKHCVAPQNAGHISVYTLGPVLAGKVFFYERFVQELCSGLGKQCVAPKMQSTDPFTPWGPY